MREDGITAIESKDDYVAFKFYLYLKDGYILCSHIVSKKKALSGGYLCRDGCLDFKDGGEKACEECVASWKEYIQPHELEVRKL